MVQQPGLVGGFPFPQTADQGAGDPALASLASRALRNYAGKHYWELLGVPVLREPAEDQSFDPGILDAPADCMLSGFFQSPFILNPSPMISDPN